MYLHCLQFLNTDMVQVVEICFPTDEETPKKTYKIALYEAFWY